MSESPRPEEEERSPTDIVLPPSRNETPHYLGLQNLEVTVPQRPARSRTGYKSCEKFSAGYDSKQGSKGLGELLGLSHACKGEH